MCIATCVRIFVRVHVYIRRYIAIYSYIVCISCMCIWYDVHVHSEVTTWIWCAISSLSKYQSWLYPDVCLPHSPIWDPHVLGEEETVIPASDWMQMWQAQVVSAPSTPQIPPAACNITTPVIVRLGLASQKLPVPRYGAFCVEQHIRRVQSWLYIQRLCTCTSKAKPAKSNHSPRSSVGLSSNRIKPW